MQPEELERIKKHYETSEEEEVKLLDKPEQSVSPLPTDVFRSCTGHYLPAHSSGEYRDKLQARVLFLISVIERCTESSCFLLFLSTWLCSRFLYELSQIPDFADRAKCIIFRSAFIDGVTSIQRKLNTVSSVREV